MQKNCRDKLKIPTVYLLSLGCPKNLVDSEVMSALLAREGFHITAHEEEADLIVVNTCAFIGPAKEEAIDEILRLALWKKAGRCRHLLVAGCLPQRYGGELVRELPEVDLFLGTGDFPKIVEALNRLDEPATSRTRMIIGKPDFLMDAGFPRLLSTPAYMAYLKISEGCDNHCSYCVIPSLRGSFRSRPMNDLIREGEQLASQGVKEIILVAQDTTAYGRDLYGEDRLPELLRRLSKIAGFQWIRILYTYPKNLSDEILNTVVSTDKICRYLDIPIQHIDDGILQAMRRKGGSRTIRERIKRAREIIPGVSLRTSLIVGFPGESPKEFRKLRNFIEEIRFDHLGVFVYSPEEGTRAARLPRSVAERTKKDRQKRILEVQSEISAGINQSRVGSIEEVLIEGNSDLPEYPYAGRTRFQAPEIDGITYVKTKDVKSGDIIRCKITSADTYDLFAENASFHLETEL